jgi:hypothetical protein
VCIPVYTQMFTTRPPHAYEAELDKTCTDNVTSQAA